MTTLITKLGGALPAKLGNYKQKKKAQKELSLTEALNETPLLDPIDLDLAREQRYECYLHLLERVRETRLQRNKQGLGEADNYDQFYQLSRAQREACSELRIHGHRGGVILDGISLQSPSHGSVPAATSTPSSGSQISPLDATHTHRLPTDGALDGRPERPNASNVHATTLDTAKIGAVGNENMPVSSSKVTSASVTGVYQNIEAGSQQHAQEAGQASKQSTIKASQATSSQQIREIFSSQISEKLRTPDIRPIPGSYFPNFNELQPKTDSSSKGLSPFGTKESPKVHPDAGLIASPRASSDYQSALENHSQASSGHTSGETAFQRNGVGCHAPPSSSGVHNRSHQSVEEFPSFRPSLAAIATTPGEESNIEVLGHESTDQSGQGHIGVGDACTPTHEMHRPNACSDIDYKQLLKEVNISDHLPETKLEIAIELVGMLQDFISQAFQEKADAEAEKQSEIDRWEEFYRKRTDTGFLSLLHPNDQLIERLERLTERNLLAPIIISKLRQDKETTRKTRQLLDRLEKNWQLSEDGTLIGERNNSNGTGEATPAQKDRKVSRTWTTRGKRKWGSWVD
ncbi:hypothetical protein ONS95_001022 [Cadophora gregata]|uniref:uncharacterized protein n=1 Tax=Cadophora gregata TaxID=51156 RepID=UPI0026DB9188|nr:uncharacterized protein ONS95_001022 [Cadophora gregata]KAK0102182.1 hypothetical protein ONS96_006144 [Cadophora gregata f. sp. sojae]KAK0129081.1 hypothetical protein ONS95_001022 [Cadophora gregata]